MGGYAILSDHHPSLATNDYLRLYDVSNGGMVLKDTLDTTNTNNSFGMQATKLTDTLGVCAFYQSNTTTAPFYVRSFKRNGEELENFGAVLSGMTLDWKHGTITRINDEKFLIIGVNASNQLLARVGTVDLSTGTITMDTQFTIYWGGAGFITVERISDENFVVMGGTNKLKVINIDPSTFAITSGATLTASTTNNRGIRKYADNKFLIINNGADGNCFSVSGTTITEGTAYTSAGGVISHSFSGLNAMVQIGDAFYTFHSSAYVVKITISGDTPTGEVLPSQTYLTNYYYPYLINNTLVLRTNTATTTLSTSILDDFTAEIRDGKADELIGTKTVVVKKPWEYSTTGGNIAYLNVSKTLSGSKKGTGYIEIKNISGGEREIRLKNIFCYRK